MQGPAAPQAQTYGLARLGRDATLRRCGQGMAGYRRGAALFDTHAPDRAATCTCRYLLPAQTGRAPPALMLARFQSHCDAFFLGAEEHDQYAGSFSGLRYHAVRYTRDWTSVVEGKSV